VTSTQQACYGFPTLTRRLAVHLVAVVLVASAAAPHADASFIGAYAVGNFNLANTNADGFVALNGAGSLVITGGNDGSSIPGITDFSLIAPATGTVSFNYAYSSLDFPGFDFSGYVVDTFTLLANSDGESGSASFLVTNGQLFAFRVSTLDNTGEPGVLTISDFNAPNATAGDVPEPSSLISAVLGLAALAAMRLRAAAERKLENTGTQP
jgi:hypothetical protein